MNPFPPIETLPSIGPLNPFRVSNHLPEEAEGLRRLGVSIVRMDYDGRFGERQIGTVTYEWLDHTSSRVAPDEAVTQSLAVFFRELLELRFPGWESAEGSCGSFEWFLDDELLNHQHAFRLIDYRLVTISLD